MGWLGKLFNSAMTPSPHLYFTYDQDVVTQVCDLIDVLDSAGKREMASAIRSTFPSVFTGCGELTPAQEMLLLRDVDAQMQAVSVAMVADPSCANKHAPDFAAFPEADRIQMAGRLFVATWARVSWYVANFKPRNKRDEQCMLFTEALYRTVSENLEKIFEPLPR